MKKPMCRLCNHPHNSWEPHVLPKTREIVPDPEFTGHMTTKEFIDEIRGTSDKPVTKVPEPVTKGRPRKYKTHAERQAAYRERKNAESERKAKPILDALGPYKEPDKIVWNAGDE